MSLLSRLSLSLALAVPCFCAHAAIHARVQPILHFNLGTDNGRSPSGALVEDGEGHLYGATITGGRHNQGTLYRVRPDGGGFVILHHFSSTGSGQGAAPLAGVVDGGDGFLYGTTESGSSDVFGGTVYRVRHDGTGFQLLKGFGVNAPEPRQPVAPLLLARDGRLYGVTRLGGPDNFGVVYVLERDGTGFAVLHGMKGAPGDGAGAVAGLVETPQGALLGLTSLGGRYHRGLFFRLARDGTGFKALHAFDGAGNEIEPFGALRPGAGGSQPMATLVQASNGLFYGNASLGGSRNGGTLFRTGSEGEPLQGVHQFVGAPHDGGDARLPLTVASERYLVGATTRGGARNQGFLFLLDLSSHTLLPLHSLQGNRDEGGLPSGPLLKSRAGAFYGVTLAGGRHGYGTLYRVNVEGW